jgi:prepilin-type N-terminal cleavage/methylation domain-containing protein
MERNEHGFTLLELVIALFVLSVAIGGLFGVLDAATTTASTDAHRIDATALAGQEIARLASGAVPSDSSTEEMNGQTYRIADSETPAGAYTDEQVAVTWTDPGGLHTIDETTASSTPATTPGPCSAPEVAAPPTATAPASGEPSIDVSWTEPTLVSSGVSIVRWAVQASPDGTVWTTVIADEPPLAAGQVHQVEVGGLQPTDSYAVRLVAYAACGQSGTSPAAVTSSATPAVSGSGCAVSAVSLDAPVAPRSASGALAADLTVLATVTSGCPDGLWVAVQTSGQAVESVALTAGSGGWYSGTLPAAGPWDLGPHAVEVGTGTVPMASLPTSASAVAELCVEQAGDPTC